MIIFSSTVWFLYQTFFFFQRSVFNIFNFKKSHWNGRILCLLIVCVCVLHLMSHIMYWISHLEDIEGNFKGIREVATSICWIRKKVDQGELKTTTEMKRSKFVKVGCTATNIQLWQYTSPSNSYSKMAVKEFIKY